VSNALQHALITLALAAAGWLQWQRQRRRDDEAQEQRDELLRAAAERHRDQH
jgi:hypothetical protein